MAVTKTNYGNFTTLEGTLAEVMGELKGRSYDALISLAYDSTASKYVAVVKTETW